MLIVPITRQPLKFLFFPNINQMSHDISILSIRLFREMQPFEMMKEIQLLKIVGAHTK